MAQDRPLDAVVVGDDALRRAVGSSDGVRLGSGDGGDEVDPVGARLFGGGAAKRVEVLGGTERSGDRSGLADQAGEPPRVDPGDTGDAVRPQHRVEVVGGATVGVTTGELADDDAAARQSFLCTAHTRQRLEVGGVDPVVADVRVRERDDLPGIARVAEYLLVAAQRRVEHDLSCGRRQLGAEQFALEHRAVSQDEQLPAACSCDRSV